VERNQKTAEYLDRVGLQGLPLHEATSCFLEAILLEEPQLAIARVDWNLLPTLCPTMSIESRFGQVLAESRRQGQSGSLNARLQSAAPEQRLGLMSSFIAEQIAGVFGISADKVELETPLTQMGLDSLMAIELKNRLEKETAVTLPMNEILNGPTLNQLAASLLRLIEGSSQEKAVDEIQPTAPSEGLLESSPEVLERVDAMSEEEIDRMLLELEGAEPAGAPEP
jgi:acyl carrier protein